MKHKRAEVEIVGNALAYLIIIGALIIIVTLMYVFMTGRVDISSLFKFSR